LIPLLLGIKTDSELKIEVNPERESNEQSNPASNSGSKKRRFSNGRLAIGITVAILSFFLIGWIISVTVIGGTQDAVSQPTFYGTGQDTTVDPPWYPCQEDQIKGNKNSKIYHIPNGDFYDKTFREVTCFDTAAEAETAGFRASRK
jgi:hypothetical protein